MIGRPAKSSSETSAPSPVLSEHFGALAPLESMLTSPADYTRKVADLHRHLDGSLRRTTLEELAGRRGRTGPADLAFEPGMGLEAALSRFAFTLAVLQEPASVRRVAAEMCEDADGE